MKNIFLASLVAGCVLVGCGVAAPNEKYWVDRARQWDLFKGREVAALAAAAGKLYVSLGESVFIVSLDTQSSTDVTRRISKQSNDQVTDILVDAARKELWVVLNQNTHLATCHDYDLAAKPCSKSFLDERMKLSEKLQRDGPKSSINTLAFDADAAIVGFFKGGIYLHSVKDSQTRPVYKPSSIDNWAVAAALTGTAAFVATRGDGLIVIDRKTAAAVRFPDKDGEYIRALAVYDRDLYIGAKGLYQTRIADLVSSFSLGGRSARH